MQPNRVPEREVESIGRVSLRERIDEKVDTLSHCVFSANSIFPHLFDSGR